MPATLVPFLLSVYHTKFWYNPSSQLFFKSASIRKLYVDLPNRNKHGDWEVERCINLEISIIKCDKHLKELLLQMLTRYIISVVMSIISTY